MPTTTKVKDPVELAEEQVEKSAAEVDSLKERIEAAEERVADTMRGLGALKMRQEELVLGVAEGDEEATAEHEELSRERYALEQRLRTLDGGLSKLRSLKGEAEEAEEAARRAVHEAREDQLRHLVSEDEKKLDEWMREGLALLEHRSSVLTEAANEFYASGKRLTSSPTEDARLSNWLVGNLNPYLSSRLRDVYLIRHELSESHEEGEGGAS